MFPARHYDNIPRIATVFVFGVAKYTDLFRIIPLNADVFIYIFLG